VYEFLDWRAEDVMSEPVGIAPDATLAEAEALFQEHGFHLLPVVDAEGRLVGVLSTLDLLGAFDFNEDVILPRYHEVMERARVRDVARSTPRTVTPRAPLTRVLRKLVDSGSKSFPVVDPEGDRLVGMVSREDVMDALRRSTQGEKPAARPGPAGGDRADST
jgi:CBS domain-containing protein